MQQFVLFQFQSDKITCNYETGKQSLKTIYASKNLDNLTVEDTDSTSSPTGRRRQKQHTGPPIWIKLPEDIRSDTSLISFRNNLKSYHFTDAYPVLIMQLLKELSVILTRLWNGLMIIVPLF